MWVRSSGRIGESVSMVSTPVSSHLLVEGDVAALVDTGVSACGEILIKELEQLLGSPERLQFICLTHAHFDHLGAVEQLRAWAPHVQLVTGPATAEILSEDENLAALRKLDAEVAEAFEKSAPGKSWETALKVDKVLGDGDTINLGDGVAMKIFFTPGHTADSVSYYVPEETVIAAGETLGSYNGRDLVHPLFLSSYQNYLTSLDKISGLDIRALILPHSGAITGELVAKYLSSLQAASKSLYESVQSKIKEGILLDEIYSEIHAEWDTANIAPEGPFVGARDVTLRQMLECVRLG